MATLSLLLLLVPLVSEGRGLPAQPPSTVAIGSDAAFFVNTLSSELWRIDRAGRLNRIDLDGARAGSIATLNGRVYVLGTKDSVVRLYASDGVRPAEVIASFEGWDRIWGLTATKTRLFLLTRTESIGSCVRLWISDGTANGTHVLSALFTDEVIPRGPAGESFLFSIYAAEKHERERRDYDLWSSNGTAGGTAFLLEQLPDNPGFVPFRDGALYHNDNSVWRTDGTAAGTFALLRPGRIVQVWPEAAYLANGPRLYRTDGTAAGTKEIGTLDFYPSTVAEFGKRILAVKDDGTRLELRAIESGRSWTLATIGRRKTEWHVRAPDYLKIGEALFFRVRNEAGRDEIWRTDGTAAGTYTVDPPAGVWFASQLYDFNGRLLFWAYDGVRGFEPWISNGHPNDARLLGESVPEAVIRGRVTDAGTGAPLTDAIIDVYDGLTLVGSEAVSESGHYAFLGATGKQLTVRARSTGSHLPATWPARIDVAPGLVVDGVDFALAFGGRIGGRVVDADGQPIAGVTVVVAEHVSAPPAATATTDADGHYLTTGVAAGTPWLVFTASHPTYSAVVYDGASCAAGCDVAGPVTRVTVPAGEARESIDFVLEPHGSLQGRILDALTGEPVMAPVVVEAWRVGRTISSPPDVRQTVTYGAGRYEVTLPDGRYWVRAKPFYAGSGYDGVWYPNAPCHDCNTAPRVFVRPIAGTALAHDFRLPPIHGRINVNVVDAATGAPLSGVLVRIMTTDSRTYRSGITDHGSFRTGPPIPPNYYFVIAAFEGAPHSTIWDGGTGKTCHPCTAADGRILWIGPATIHEITLRMEK